MEAALHAHITTLWDNAGLFRLVESCHASVCTTNGYITCQACSASAGFNESAWISILGFYELIKDVDYTLEFIGYRRHDGEIFFIPGKGGGQIEGGLGRFPAKACEHASVEDDTDG
ncbi:MAG: hypothetical protein N839_0016585 [Desulfofustis sp. PB-SRB1]|nr:hypothetical protein [Desulfofustis sp. PB-SRB1]